MYAPILILSKGRPQCQTAMALRDLDNPPDFMIVCGDNDETVPEYVRNFGQEHVLVFDHSAWWECCDMMDAYGTDRASGISPVRNFMIHYAREHGYTRCWQFDDDMECFYATNRGKNDPIIDGRVLEDRLDEIAMLADASGMGVVGIPAWQPGKSNYAHIGREVCCLHCAPTSRDMLYRARIFEDAVCMFDSLRVGVPEYEFRSVSAKPVAGVYGRDRAKEEHVGGLRELYDEAVGYDDEATTRNAVRVSNTAYIVMAMPNGCVLSIDTASNKYKMRYGDDQYRPKLLRDEWRRA